MASGLSNIEHFVVLRLENRSFDHMLGWLKAQDPRIEGLTGAESNRLVPADPASSVTPVSPSAGFADPDVDPGHELADVNEQLFGSRLVHNGVAPTNMGFLAN